MLGSTLIMVFIPTIVLVASCVILMRAIPEGSQRKKILRIMLVIIVMFIICHVPKVIFCQLGSARNILLKAAYFFQR